jgi:MoxR-like ATPase
MEEPRTPGDVELFLSLGETRSRLVEEIRKVIVGQDHVVDLMLLGLFSQGHCLLIGVPGLAKTLLVSTTAQALGLDFGRIQFTPDLMPADILGTEVLEEDRATGTRSLRFLPGPIFCNMLLADEVNRTPPKTQAALLQAMQERQVTAGGESRDLAPPFQVFATQNPIEQEGTYPLPEAQLDRFMLSIHVGYPGEDEEVEVVRRTTTGKVPQVKEVVTRETLLSLQDMVRRLPSSETVDRFAVRLARATRPGPEACDAVQQWVQWGAGPRASQHLALGARVWAALRGNEVPHVQDVKAIASAVLGHRVLLNFEADAQGVGVDQVLEAVLESLPEDGV